VRTVASIFNQILSPVIGQNGRPVPSCIRLEKTVLPAFVLILGSIRSRIAFSLRGGREFNKNPLSQILLFRGGGGRHVEGRTRQRPTGVRTQPDDYSNWVQKRVFKGQSALSPIRTVSCNCLRRAISSTFTTILNRQAFDFRERPDSKSASALKFSTATVYRLHRL